MSEIEKTNFVIDLAKIKSNISEKKEILRKASLELKSYFVGLDYVIDNVMSNIEAWFVMPDLLKRPVIVNLWGLTGVGKTDLVRRLVKEIGFNDRYIEIQMSSGKSASRRYSSPSIQEYLNCSDLNPGEPGVLLLDEIQNFRSIDNDNNETEGDSFQDVWTLLSDGRFSQSNFGIKEKIFTIVFDKEVDWETEKKEGKGQSFSHAKYLKKFLKLQESIEEIMCWDDMKKNKTLLDRMKDQNLYDGDDYSKLLIFISGNLDEAFTMANSLEDVDVDADVFHNYSKTIDVITIKKALKKRFKPEQISRLGNTHIIYPSLSKDSYSKIIVKKLQESIKDVKNIIGVNIDIDMTLYDFIYRNGVFPSQGTRPLFSTIAMYFEANIPNFLLIAIESNANQIKLSYDASAYCIVMSTTDQKILTNLSVIGMIDKLRSNEDKNEKRKVIASVHEGAHALVYALNFRIAPVQTVSNAVDDQTFGFIRTHDIMQNRDVILKKIMVSLAGLVAEEMIFGKEIRTVGSDNDIEYATTLAGELIRKHAMESKLSKISTPYYGDNESKNQIYLSYDIDSTNEMIEKILIEQKDETRSMLGKNFKMYKEIVDTLIKNGKITKEELREMLLRYEISIRVIDNDEIVFIGDFKTQYDQMCSKMIR